jgi:thiol-disulfide isomerase/thioredoxin
MISQTINMLHRFLTPSVFVLVCGIASLLATTSRAKERTVEEFIDYSTRRIGSPDLDLIAKFAEAVDVDKNGKISDEEFSRRIEAYQAVFLTVQPTRRQAEHALPDNWFNDFQKATAEAKKTNRPMLVMFSASWCAPCKMMIAQVFPDDKVKAALKDVVPVYVDSEVDVALATENGIRAYPTFVCLSATGQAVTSRVGGGDVPKFIEMIDTFKLAAEAAQIDAAQATE